MLLETIIKGQPSEPNFMSYLLYTQQDIMGTSKQGQNIFDSVFVFAEVFVFENQLQVVDNHDASML